MTLHLLKVISFPQSEAYESYPYKHDKRCKFCDGPSEFMTSIAFINVRLPNRRVMPLQVSI